MNKTTNTVFWLAVLYVSMLLNQQCATAYRTNWRPWLDGRLKVPDFITLKPIAPALKNDGRHSNWNCKGWLYFILGTAHQAINYPVCWQGLNPSPPSVAFGDSADVFMLNRMLWLGYGLWNIFISGDPGKQYPPLATCRVGTAYDLPERPLPLKPWPPHFFISPSVFNWARWIITFL